MTKQTRTVRLVSLASLRAATGGMQISIAPRTNTTGSSSSSSGPTSVIGTPSTPTTSHPQIAPVAQ